MYKCTDLTSLFNAISTKKTLYLPVDGTDGRAHFKKWSNDVKYSKALNTVRSAKDFFFPHTENLMAFKTQGKCIEVVDTRCESEDFVIFGMRECDVKSLEILDKVFLADPVDTYYASRREHGIIISVACNFPSETCFCGTFGIDASSPTGDIACYFEGDTVYLDAVTSKGIDLMESLNEICVKCDDSAVKNLQKIIKERLNNLPLNNLTTEGFGEGQTETLFNDERWETMSKACLGCGTCTYTCPTCQCYDIRDFNNGKSICRYRCWDSCMYSDFTKMSAGQPRTNQAQRFRQRFMHKLVYFPENNNGLFSCVGCGRCLNYCPVSLNIVKVMKELGGNE